MGSQGLTNAVLGLTLLIVMALVGWGYYLVGQPLPQVNFRCRFPSVPITKVENNPEFYKLPKRNPFFYPKLEVSVDLDVVSKEADTPTRTPEVNMVYKGMMVWGEDKIAIIYLVGDKKTKFVKLGEFVKGYKVLDITEDTVVLSKQGGLSLITLKLGGLSEK